MNKIIKYYLEEFKNHYRYSITNLSKIERIENYILYLLKENYKLNLLCEKYIIDVDKALYILKTEDGSIPDYKIIEDAIEILEEKI